jgi:hypothetical protein
LADSKAAKRRPPRAHGVGGLHSHNWSALD